MKTYFTTVKYAPNPDRDEFFGIGLIMVSPESGAVKVRFPLFLGKDFRFGFKRGMDIYQIF